MAGDAQRVNDLLALSHVPRWTVVNVTHPQSVADHSYRVAVIAFELYLRIHEHKRSPDDVREILGEILLWALVHDGGESHTGDVPGHVKYGNPSLKSALHRVELRRCPWLTSIQPSPFVKCLVKIADLIECTTYMWMNKHGSHAGWVWRYLDGRLTDAVNGCCDTLGIELKALHPIVIRLVSDIQTEEGRLQA